MSRYCNSHMSVPGVRLFHHLLPSVTFHLLSTHADRHAVDISFTVCLCVCVCLSAGYFVRDISGVGWHRPVIFCRVVDLGVRQVISPFGELWPRG